MRLCYPLPDGRVRLYLQVGQDELRGLAPGEVAQWCREALAEVPALRPLTEPALAALDHRQLLPASRFLADRLAAPGLALVGEAAHAVHPMASQGMNSAIADAARWPFVNQDACPDGVDCGTMSGVIAIAGH